MKAITVCVEFHDILALTLHRNARHFSRVVIVTTPEDVRTQAVASMVPNAVCHLTRIFHANRCPFNKGAAIEEAFDTLGRDGWFVHMDADVVLPAELPPLDLRIGCLYTPLRRMIDPVPAVIPPEPRWKDYPLHPQQREWAGYFQLAHADDPVLKARPWYPTTWKHGGGSDSEFQAKWATANKVRPPFEVLHLGPSGANWCGRATPFTDGTVHPEASQRVGQLRRFIRGRTSGPDRFEGEKVRPGMSGW